MNIQQLSTSEKILLAEQLWESVRVEAANSDRTDAQRQELDSRLSALEVDQDLGGSWNAAKSRIINS